MIQQLDKNGFTIVPDVFDGQEISDLKQCLAQFDKTSDSVGIRDLITKYPAMRELATSTKIRQLVEPILGPSAAVVRSIFFNKSVDANWQVAWHQDVTIAVKKKIELTGFDNWSVKDTIPHVQPPVDILQNMLTVRIHLDFADAANGALWVVPESHTLGRVPANSASVVADSHVKQLCQVAAGGVMLFRPLILHASKKAITDCPRRVIHFEFAAKPLTEPLEWWEWVA